MTSTPLSLLQKPDPPASHGHVPPGYGHGFLVISEIADFQYKCTEFYYPEDEDGISWNDPDIGIEWPTSSPQLSERDKNAITLDEFLKGSL